MTTAATLAVSVEVDRGHIPVDRILAHRGWWHRREERNTFAALSAALEAGYGIETDIRDRDSQLVIAHDPATRDSLPLAQLLERYLELGATGILALNIKADGLAASLARMLGEYGIGAERAFVFDMSIPDMLGYVRAGIPYYTRQSEYEPQPALLEGAAGIWLDAFHSCWYGRGEIESHLAAGRDVCIVSAELHGRPYEDHWQRIRQVDSELAGRLLICTDFPHQYRKP